MWILVDTDSPESMLTKIHNAIWRHQATTSHTILSEQENITDSQKHFEEKNIYIGT